MLELEMPMSAVFRGLAPNGAADGGTGDQDAVVCCLEESGGAGVDTTVSTDRGGTWDTPSGRPAPASGAEVTARAPSQAAMRTPANTRPPYIEVPHLGVVCALAPLLFVPVLVMAGRGVVRVPGYGTGPVHRRADQRCPRPC
jgi:hypothetical protein